MEKDNILEALGYIDPSSLNYSDWVMVGMALKSEGYPCSIWDEWSKNDKRYKPGECERKWAGFSGSSKPVTGGTIVQMAKANGYARSKLEGDMLMDWDDEIEYDGEAPKQKTVSQTEQLIKYLETLFEPEDYVGIITNDSFKDQDGKWKPRRGVFDRTQKELIVSLRRYPNDLGATIGDWHEEAGAWIRFNPLDGKGAKKENVTKYRYALVECDNIPLDEQRKAYERYNLPIAALVYSGGKSIHAIVHIDASDRFKYIERVDFLYEFLKSKGLDFDVQNKDENRMSRLPGATRNGKEQTLLAINIGASDYEDWIEGLKGEELSEDDISELLKNPPPLAPVIMEGLLRRGHKMLLSGASKSGKSFALIELSVCLSEGLPFLDFRCRKSKVVYINFEIDRPSSIKRFVDVYEALKIKNPNNSIIALNLRGKARPLKDLVPTLVRKYKGKGIDVFIIDPIYKVITGDENNASEMAEFCNQFDIICDQLGATVIYAHHHSKGTQGGKNAQDRSSGSGVFSRDPDAILDLIEIDIDEAFRAKYLDQDCPDTAWEVECIAREFRKPKNRKCWFRYPLHVIAGDELKNQFAKGSIDNARKSSPTYSTKEGRREALVDAFDAISMGEAEVDIKEIAKYLDISERTVRTYVKENDDIFENERGKVRRK